MKNENMHSHIEFSKHGINKGVSKPPISPGGLNNPNTVEMLNVFDRNVQQMMNPQISQTREIVIGNVRHPAPRIQHQQGNYITANHYNINGSMNPLPIKSGSEYSSPRSSVGTPGDSQNSSPSSSLIQPSQPPPPYGANNRHSIASNISSLSLDSFGKGSSSPRFISPRNSLVITDGIKYKNYVNEPAPPAPMQGYIDPRIAAALFQQPKVTVTFQPMAQQNGGITTTLSRGSPPPAIPARIPKNTPKSPSETQVDLLTQQLKENMNFGSQIPTEPPPPYHGPHKTEPMPGPSPRNLTPTISTQPAVSPRVHTTVGTMPMRPSVQNTLLIQQHRTPPKPKGPTSAEKRMEELTKQVEKEMETAQGEYFGRFLSGSLKRCIELFRKCVTGLLYCNKRDLLLLLVLNSVYDKFTGFTIHMSMQDCISVKSLCFIRGISSI